MHNLCTRGGYKQPQIKWIRVHAKDSGTLDGINCHSFINVSLFLLVDLPAVDLRLLFLFLRYLTVYSSPTAPTTKAVLIIFFNIETHFLGFSHSLLEGTMDMIFKHLVLIKLDSFQYLLCS